MKGLNTFLSDPDKLLTKSHSLYIQLAELETLNNVLMNNEVYFEHGQF